MRVAESRLILMTAMETIRPDYVALMVSGGHDSAATYAVAVELGEWLDSLEREVVERHGFGWGAPFPKKRNVTVPGFMPMCVACNRRGVQGA